MVPGLKESSPGLEKIPEKFEELMPQFEGLMRYAARINSENIPGLEFDDMLQHARILLHEHWTWLKHLNMREFTKFFKTSLFREMKGLRRARFIESRNTKHEAFSLDDSTEEQKLRLVAFDRPEEEAEVGELIDHLRKSLTPFDFNVLQEMIYPSSRMCDLMKEDDKKKFRMTYDVAIHQLARFFSVSNRKIIDAKFRIQTAAREFKRKP